jgi:hypothetical protein
MPDVTCPYCTAENVASEVFVFDPIESFAQCAGPRFVDHRGKFHFHPIAQGPVQCSCSKGHLFRSDVTYECWCGWTSGELS